MYTALMLLFALFLITLNALFVAAEFSFVKVRKTQLELLAVSGNRAAVSALFGVTHLDAYLSVCQLGITLASLGLGWIGEPAVAHLLAPLFRFFSITNPALISSLSIALGFSIITILHVVFGELAPKSISIQKAEATALLLARPMRFFYWLCFPLVIVMNGISNGVLRLAGLAPASEAGETHSAEELRMMIMDSSKRGQLEKDEGRMLDNIFSFHQKEARDIMVHRMDVLALDVEDTREDALELARASGHTRFPVYEGNRDHIVGFVHLKDLLRCEEGLPLKDLMRAPLFMPDSTDLDRLMRHMQKNHQQICVVVDEYGTWQGILTMENIVEAIVGDIQDEFDVEEPDVVKQPDGSYLVSGDLSLDDLAEYMPVEYQDHTLDPYKIIAAYFIDALGRIPKKGDAVHVAGKIFTVVTMQKNTVRRVRVEDEKEGEAGSPQENF